MLTKSVKSVISVVLKHVARAKKIRAIGVIREYNIRMVLPDCNIFCDFAILSALCTFCLHCVDNQADRACRHHLHTTTLVCTLSARYLHSV